MKLTYRRDRGGNAVLLCGPDCVRDVPDSPGESDWGTARDGLPPMDAGPFLLLAIPVARSLADAVRKERERIARGGARMHGATEWPDAYQSGQWIGSYAYSGPDVARDGVSGADAVSLACAYLARHPAGAVLMAVC